MPATTEGRLGLLEQKGAVMAQQISDISRTLDRVIPYGESLVELRGMLGGLQVDVTDIRSEIVAARLEAEATEKQHRIDRRADRRIWWGIAGGIATMLLAAGIGVVLG